MQASQKQVETDKRVAQLTDSLKQVQHQAAALAQDKERLAGQLQQRASASGGVPEVGLVHSWFIAGSCQCPPARALAVQTCELAHT